MKYMQCKRESLRLNLPLGTKDLCKDYAADMGTSVTELITRLIEKDMKENKARTKPAPEGTGTEEKDAIDGKY